VPTPSEALNRRQPGPLDLSNLHIANLRGLASLTANACSSPRNGGRLSVSRCPRSPTEKTLGEVARSLALAVPEVKGRRPPCYRTPNRARSRPLHIGPVIVVESLGGRMLILIKPFLFLIAFGPIAVLFASVFGLACLLLMTCARAIAWLPRAATEMLLERRKLARPLRNTSEA
jgi:hypothetical protein